jgi:hypothetical protein
MEGYYEGRPDNTSFGSEAPLRAHDVCRILKPNHRVKEPLLVHYYQYKLRQSSAENWLAMKRSCVYSSSYNRYNSNYVCWFGSDGEEID